MSFLYNSHGVLYPNCLQATIASLHPQLKSHTAVQCPVVSQICNMPLSPDVLVVLL